MNRPLKDTLPPPGPELNAQVRAAFVLSGTSLNAWCRANGEHRQNAWQVLTGLRKGPAAQELLGRLLRACGLQDKRRSARA